MTDYAEHRPSFDGTSTADWDAPRERDFQTDDLGEIAEHYVLSSSGFPPASFSDLAVPVVEPGGALNAHALRTARREAHRAEEIDDEVVSLLDELLDEQFDAGATAGDPDRVRDPAEAAEDDDPGETRQDEVDADAPRSADERADDQYDARPRDAEADVNQDAHRDEPPFNS